MLKVNNALPVLWHSIASRHYRTRSKVVSDEYGLGVGVVVLASAITGIGGEVAFLKKVILRSVYDQAGL
jgi:hypothetical protein